MRYNRIIRSTIIFFVLVIHLIVGYYFLVRRPLELPAQCEPQLLGLIFTSAFMAVIIHLNFNSLATKAALFIRFFTIIMLLEALPEQIDVYSILLGVFIFEIFLIVPYWIIGIFSGVFLTIFFTLQRYANNEIWNISYPTPQINDFIIPWTQCFIALIFGLIIRILIEYYYHAINLTNHYQQSNVGLVEANIRLQEYTVRLQRESIVNERNRISREIHDSVGYIITNLIAVLDYALELISINKEAALESMDNCRYLARSALDEVRRAVRALRPSIEINHLQAIPNLVKAFSQATGIDVSLRITDISFGLGEEYEWLIYRVIQEALTNTFRHGQASLVYIALWIADDRVHLRIKDNGAGTLVINPGCGLTGIQERVRAFEGKFLIETAPGSGFTIYIWLPWKRGEDNGTNTSVTC